MSDPVFFSPARSFTAGEIALMAGCELSTPDLAGNVVSGLAPLSESLPGSLVFASGKQGLRHLAGLKASAVILNGAGHDAVPAGIAVLVSKAPQQAFASIGRLLFPSSVRPSPMTGETGISRHAFVHDTAQLEEGAIVEPGAVIGAHAEIGSGSVVGPNAVVGENCRIGRDCYIGPCVTIRAAFVGNGVIIHDGVRIGQDGFGFVPGAAGLEKVPQIGRVIIQDNVEIGANTTIDRGALSDTVIGEGTKIDNLVQVAHNVRVGRHTVIAAQTGISGSVTIGDMVMIGGNAGFTDHVTVGNGAQIAAGSGVMHDIPAGEKWGGAPAQPIRLWLREVAELRKLTKTSKGNATDGGK